MYIFSLNDNLKNTNTIASSKNGLIHSGAYFVGNFTLSAKGYIPINRTAFTFLPSNAKFIVTLRYYATQGADLTLYQNDAVIYLTSAYGGSFEEIYLNVWWWQ